jgi:sigma-E factor negative regulatory protein RseC
MALLEEEGVVVAVDGAMARVRVARASACGGCASQGACNPLDDAGQEIVIQAANPAHARPGDRVAVGIDDRAVVKGAAWVYALPLVTFFLGYGLGGLLAPAGDGGESGGAIAGALLGLVGGLVFVAWRSRGDRFQAAYRPRILRTL